MYRLSETKANDSLAIKFLVRRATVTALTVVMAFAFVATSVAQTKSGLGGDNNPLITGVNAGWYYDWGLGANPDVAHAEFVPMFWSGGSVNANNIQKVVNNSSSEYVLGFNEPERDDQSNMTVATAISRWGDLQTLRDNGFKLVSPAPSDTADGRQWLSEFMTAVDADPNLEVDEVAFHWYGSVNPGNPTGSANAFLNKVDQYHNAYGRPVWVTEFAGIDWANNFDTPTMQEANRIFLERAIAGLESRSYVTRYAWWNHNNDSRLLTTNSNLPTVAGEAWIQTILETGDQLNVNGQIQGDDVFYLRGGDITNTGNSMGPALRYLDAIGGNSRLSGTGDFAIQGGEDAYVLIREGATLRKQGSNTVTLPGTQFYNDGTMLLQDGTLHLENGAHLTGGGSLRIDGNGALTTSTGTGGENVALDSALIILNNGLLHLKDGRTEISQQLRFWNASEVRTDGDLLISGFTAGAGRILSTGTGSLFLTGEGLHANGATVSQGNLVVANPLVSATGSGNVLVNGTGTLGGFGQIGGDVVTAAGGVVAPGVSSSMSTLTTVPIAKGVIVDALDFDFRGVQDDAPLTQTSNLSDGLRLVSGLDFGSGVQPRNAFNDGNEFNVIGFGSGTNYGAASNNGDYLTFTIAPVEGLAMVIEDVTFDLRRQGSAAAEQYVIGTSIDGFTWPERWGAITLNDTETHEFIATNPGNEAVTGEVEIRVVGMDAFSAGAATHFYGASVDASFISDPDSIVFDPTGILTLGGDYTQLDFATLEIDLGGTSASAGAFDRLQVSGNVALDGTLDVSFVDGFNGTPGQTFDIITANSVSGTFDTVIAPDGTNVQVNYLGSIVRLELLAASLNCDAAGGMECDLADIDALYAEFGTTVTAGSGFDYSGDGVIGPEDIVGWLADASQATNTANPTGVTYILGDADLDGNVNSTDLGLLLNNFNATSVVGWNQGDLNGTGAVNSIDLGLLLNNFGSSSSLAANAVPEPSTKLPLIVICIAAIFRLRHRRNLLG